ncbi:hypothetical protein NKJ26_08295 [Mesorhizobium sp. M0152]|uniref:hypothetical protein n=1 Tax=Mesorhizobium sp. M0152 TaxID=2956898 RepID=UPI00333819FB
MTFSLHEPDQRERIGAAPVPPLRDEAVSGDRLQHHDGKNDCFAVTAKTETQARPGGIQTKHM